MNTQKSKIEQLQALKIGKGIQYLLNEAYKILGNPILANDMEFRLIARSENIVTDDPIWNEITTAGTVSRDRLEFYKNESFLDAVANARKITFLISDKLKYDRIIGKLFNSDKIQIGIASIEAHQPFGDDTPELFECFCDILNKEIAKSEYFRNYGQQYQEFLINKLIEGRIEDKELYAAHVESIYMNLKDHLYLAVVDTARNDAEHTGLSYFRDLFKHAQRAFKYSVYADYIVIIMSSDYAVLDIKEDLRKLNRLFKQHNLYAGISGCFNNLFELRKYYIEALSALNRGLKGDSGQRVFYYNEARQ